MSIVTKLNKAHLVYPVGPLSYPKRLLKNLLSKSGLWIGFGVGLNLSMLLLASSFIEQDILSLQVKMEHFLTAQAKAQPFLYQKRFEAQDKMAVGDYRSATDLFMQAAQQQHDLQDAGMALRTAALLKDPTLLHQTGLLFNTVLDDVIIRSEQVHSSFEKGINPLWRWQQPSSMSVLMNQWKALDPSSFSEKKAQFLVSLQKQDPGYFDYLNLTGIDEQALLNLLREGQPGWQKILGFQISYQQWLEGKWTKAEAYSASVKYTLANQNIREQTLNPQSLIQDHSTHPSDSPEKIQAGLLKGSVADVFIQNHLKQGFTPWQIFELWTEQELWGDSNHEMVNQKIPQTREEADLEQIRQQARTWLSEVKTPQDLTQYYQKWQKMIDKNPVEFSIITSKDGYRLQLGGIAGYAVNWVERSEGLSGIHFHSIPAFSDISFSNMNVRNLEKALAQSATAFPTSTPHAPYGLSMVEAQQILQQALEQTGLRRIAWPKAIPNTPNHVWQMAYLIQQSNAELEQETGLKGALLGLKGRSSLILNSTSFTYDAGLTSFNHADNTLVTNAVILEQKSLGPIGHEWMHGFDAIHPCKNDYISDSSMKGVFNPLHQWFANSQTKAWEQLWRSTLYPNANAHDIQRAQQNRWLEDQLRNTPMLEGVLNQELASIRTQTWTPAVSQKHWSLIDSNDVSPQTILGLKTQLSYLNQLWKNPNGTSAWVDFSQHIPVSFGQKNEDSTLYTGNAMELVARSFASQLPSHFLIREGAVDRYGAAFMYPGSEERMIEKKAWQRFFTQEQTWWTSLASKQIQLTSIVKKPSSQQPSQTAQTQSSVKKSPPLSLSF